MAAPLFVVATFKVKEGRAEDLKGYYRKILDIVEANEPRVFAFHGFLNEDETEMTSIQVHPDTDSMVFHMQVLKDNWDESFSEYSEMLETIRVEYYGTPPQSALNFDAGLDGVGLKPRHIAGFTRAVHSPRTIPGHGL
jgi:hypothetical protein